ncbi:MULTISPECIES: PilN domain-containing protein [Methylobacter]|jgi:general secretion pathway protein L|uniref:PilN domain-containing protein n=1 Tax=Methylobacter TaxID=429 RepID=UPI0003829084|nr:MULTISPECIES: PilN domain-containing protein [Methylobacter]
MLNLNSTIDLDFKKFFRWWARELDFLVPEKIKRLVHEKQGVILIRPDNNHLEMTYILNGKVEPIATLERNESDIADVKALLAKDERFAKTDVVLRLTREQAIQKTLVLPLAARENLAQVVSYELDRYTPFKPEQVYFAVKPLTDPHEPGQMNVMLVLTPREVLEALYTDIKALGLSPKFADYEDAPNDLEQNYDYYNLLPDRFREKIDKNAALFHSALIVSVFALLLAVIALPVWFEYQAVDALNEQLDGIEKEARKIDALQSEIDALVEESRRLVDVKSSAPSVVIMLNALSSLIKDDTWLTYAQYSDGHLQIQGESPSASALIAVLEASPLFDNVRFVSPVTQDRISGLERFQITVDVNKAGGISAGL